MDRIGGVMKTVILMRHGDAEPGSSENGDEQRPLSERGRQQSRRIGRRMAELGVKPDHALVSAATRTSETALELFAMISRPPEMTIDRAFYVGGPSTWVDRLQTLPAKINTVLCVGHNPSMGTLATMLAGRRMDFRTATTAIIGLEIDDWQRVMHRETNVTVSVLRPEDPE